MVFNDGTMHVIEDGVQKIRLVDHVSRINGYSRTFPKYDTEKEMVVWSFGSDVPTIVRIAE